MKFPKEIYIIVLMASLLVVCNKEHTTEVASVPCNIPDLEKTLVENSNQLGFDCFRRLSTLPETESENLVISPIGISLSLSALLKASHNRTNSEVKNCLHINNFPDSAIIEGYKHINKVYSEIDNKAEIKNSSEFAFDQDFDLISNFQKFYSETGYVNVIGDNNAGFIDDINNKVNQSKNGQFQMINTFNFKAQSQSQIRTEESPFYRSPNESSFIPMIVSKSNFNYYTDQTVQVVEIPLGRGNFNIMLIVPQSSESINDLCYRMDKRIIDKIKKKFKPTMLEVIMPQLELSAIKSIKEVFSNYRLPSAFSEKMADFSNIAKARNIFMNDFEHVVNVNIASSGVKNEDSQNESFDNNNSSTVLIDHPFIFVIYEKYSEAILCLGKISNI